MVLNSIKHFLLPRGRINRTEFLAGLFVIYSGYYLLFLPFLFTPATITTLANYMYSGVFVVLCFMLVIRRVHDYDETAWYALLVMIPVVNLYVVFTPGSPAPNRYGTPPPPASMLHKLLAIGLFVLPILLLTGLSLMHAPADNL